MGFVITALMIWASNLSAQAAPKDLEKSLTEMREIAVALRAPKAVCKDLATDLPALSGAAQSRQQDLLAGVILHEGSDADFQVLKKKTESCRKECLCSALSDLLEKIPGPGKWAALKDQAEASAEKMMDADYVRCQKRFKIKCSNAEVRSLINALRESSSP